MLVRWFTRLLVLSMVPVLIVTMPRVADAAPVLGPSESATVDTGDDALSPGADADTTRAVCNVVGQWVVDDVQGPATGGLAGAIAYNASCSTAWNVADPKIVFAPSGPGCVQAGAYSYQTPTGSMSGTMALSGFEGCNVTELCWQYASGFKTNPFQIHEGSGCVPWLLGPPPNAEADARCEYGAPARPAIAGHPDGDNGVPLREVTFKVNDPAQGSEPGKWLHYVVHRSNTLDYYSYASGVLKTESLGGPTILASYSVLYPLGTGFQVSVPVQVGPRQDRGQSHMFPIVGAGMVYVPAVELALGFGASAVGRGLATLPGESVAGQPSLMGVTNPDLCAFYWGEKLGEGVNPDDLTDDPLGGLDPSDPGTSAPPIGPAPAPDPQAEGCDFSFTDPTTWATGALCVLVGLIQNVLGVIFDIFGILGDVLDFLFGFLDQLVQALIDLALSLFVPETPISERLDSMRSAFDDRAPFSWLSTIADVPASVPGGGIGMRTAPQAPSASPEFASAATVASGGCPDWRITVGELDTNVVCGQPYTDELRGLRPILFAFLALLAFWPMVRSIYYGSIPIISAKRGGSD